MNIENKLINGIVGFEEKLLKALDQHPQSSDRSSIGTICGSLHRFLEKENTSFPQAELRQADRTVQKIIQSGDFSDQKLGKLLTKLDVLKSRILPERPTPQLLDMEQFSQQLRLLEVQQRAIAETRSSLSKMKKGTKVIVDEKMLSASTAEKFGEQFGKNFEAILQNMFLHTLKKLELRSIQAPDLTQWSILLLGSLARSEGHPYSDIDMLILIDPELEKDEKSQKFFQHFMQEFADLIHQTGEEFAGFKLCGGNLTPPYQPYEFRHADSGKQPNSTTRGMGSFLTTPERLAVSFYQSAVSYMPIKGKGNFFKSPLSGNENLMGATLLDAHPVFGNLNLFDQFVQLKNALGELKASELFEASHFSDAPWGPETTADQLAYRSILGSLTQTRGKQDYEKSSLNVKKDFMRPIQIGVSVLANQFHIKEKSTAKRLEKLAEKGIISRQEAHLMKSVYLQMYQMRIENAVAFGAEQDNVALSDTVFTEAQEKLDSFSKQWAQLQEEEKQLIRSKRTGKENVNDLVRLRLNQDAYAEECLHLIRLLQLKRKADPQAFKAASQVCLHVIEKINRYVALNCDKRSL